METSAANTIHQYVGVLRRLLEPDLPLRSPGSYLLRSANGYFVEADTETLDLLQLRDLITRAEAEAGSDRPGPALDRYAEALALVHGPAGHGMPDIALPVFASLDDEFADARAATDTSNGPYRFEALHTRSRLRLTQNDRAGAHEAFVQARQTLESFQDGGPQHTRAALTTLANQLGTA